MICAVWRGGGTKVGAELRPREGGVWEGDGTEETFGALALKVNVGVFTAGYVSCLEVVIYKYVC